MKDIKNLTDYQRKYLAGEILRFQLDWIPMLQMLTDADRCEGKIDEVQAKERRDLIEYFYELSKEVSENLELKED